MIDVSKRVLVADDEENVRLVLQRMLMGEGYEVITAANGQEAVDRLTQSGIRIVLMDVRMPVMSGMEALQRIMASYPDSCVIMVTAIAEIQTAVECMKLGAYDYITKPFERQQLMATLRGAILKRQARLEDESRLLELTRRVAEQADRLQELFRELVETLAREHRLLYQLASEHAERGKAMLSELPPELQEPMSSAVEFRDALLRILRRGSSKP